MVYAAVTLKSIAMENYFTIVIIYSSQALIYCECFKAVFSSRLKLSQALISNPRMSAFCGHFFFSCASVYQKKKLHVFAAPYFEVVEKKVSPFFDKQRKNIIKKNWIQNVVFKKTLQDKKSHLRHFIKAFRSHFLCR